jgi:NAD(P)-dependent dehydrogenase (short-subunit alcohol dehydrogenase family)
MTERQVLVIGGTTEGIGQAFVNRLDGEERTTLFVPTPVDLDVRSVSSIQKWINSHPYITHTLYCAGTKHLSWIEDLDWCRMNETFDVNLFGFLKLMQVHAEINKLGGRICVITSDAAITPMRASVDYCASKAALQMAIKIDARDFPWWQITGIMPSIVADTEMTKQDIAKIAFLRGWSEAQTEERMIESTPMRRMVDKADVAKVAEWLLFESPDSMTGSIVEIRGGK